MRERAFFRSVSGLALLWVGSAMPTVVSAHWEGFEAADPATPAAVLRLDSAVTRYSALDAGPLPWRARFEGEAAPAPDAHAHMGHSGAPESPPATTQQ